MRTIFKTKSGVGAGFRDISGLTPLGADTGKDISGRIIGGGFESNSNEGFVGHWARELVLLVSLGNESAGGREFLGASQVNIWGGGLAMAVWVGIIVFETFALANMGEQSGKA